MTEEERKILLSKIDARIEVQRACWNRLREKGHHLAKRVVAGKIMSLYWTWALIEDFPKEAK